METPNTRSRRKRELLGSSQEEQASIAWVHDQGLRKAVLLATENDQLELPAPTQKPRPISSLLSPSASSSTHPASSRPRRKRPCRNHRSLPSLNGHTHSPPSSKASSAPNCSGTGSVQSQSNLDMLLGEAMLSFGLGSGRDRAHNRKGVQGGERQVSKSTISTKSALQVSTANGQETQRFRLQSTSQLSPAKKTSHLIVLHSSTKTGPSPRIGLRSNNTPTSTVQRARSMAAPGSQKPFRPPFQAAQPIRSSPRRVTTSHHNSQSTGKAPIRGPSIPAIRSDVSKTNTDPSSEGDQSFDSLDGIFQDGGPEIEELLRQVDGSQ